MARLRRLVLHRLLSYYRLLSEWTSQKTVKTVTSSQIGEALDIDPTQVRKDLAAIGATGMGRVGFEVCEVCRAIRIVLGFDHGYESVLIGTGHLGGALLAYPGFAKYGLQIVAAFDSDQRKIGRRIGELTVKPMSDLKPFIRRRKIRLAILTTPAEVSQKVTDRLVSAGVSAIWNFAPTSLAAPPGVLVRNEHIARGLSEIGHHLHS